MKRTATEYLFEQLWDTPKDKFAWHSILIKAKEMEKEQIKDAYSAGVWEIGYYNRKADAKEYYNKTYKENEKGN
jgi:hypothetical protein